MNILIEGAGTATAISVLKGLQKQTRYSYRTIVLDMNEMAAGRYMADKFYKCPKSTAKNYIGFVLDICEKEKVDLYIPIIDYGFETLSANKEKFEQLGTTLLIADPPSIAICADKLKTYEFFVENSIPSPKTWEGIVKHFPMIIKPRWGGRATINVYKVTNNRELEFYTHDNDNFILQEFVEGQEFTADNLSTLEGKYIDSVVRKRVDTKGGLSTKVKAVENDEPIKRHLKTIIETLAIPGACNIQGFVNKEGKILFTEINPRFAGTHAATIEFGLNSIEHIISMVRKEFVMLPPLDKDLTVTRYWNEVYVREDKIWTWENLIKK